MAICGICGLTDEVVDDDGLCLRGHDCWLEPPDFKDPDLRDYVLLACKRLHKSRNELEMMVLKSSGRKS
jgi:hypothetical protein